MYIIDSMYDKPDIEYMKNRAMGFSDEGIAVKNVDYLYEKIAENKKAAEKNIRSLYNIVNPNSTQQILDYLQNIMDENIMSACYRNEKWTTDKAALGDLALKGYQEAIDILTYRKIKKYLESVDGIRTNLCRDGRVRPEISFSKTNRINFKQPALMNIPKPLLWNLIAPREEGNILISIDIKNQEPAIMINMLKIQTLLEILEGDGGLYEEVFERVFGRQYENVIEKNELKASWNAMTYGATLFGVKDICRHIEAEKLYEFFSKIPEFKKYRGRCFGISKKKVQEVPTYFGTIVRADKYGPQLARVLMDIPIQGTGSDILALLIKHFDDEVENRELDDKLSIYFTRHDEIIIEANREYVEDIGLDAVLALLKDIFEHRIDDWEPFQVKIGEVVPAELFSDESPLEDDDSEE